MPGFYAWGSNASGALARAGDVGSHSVWPTFVGSALSGARGGADFACMLNVSVSCWGSNSAGQLGRGSGFQDAYSPTPAVVGLTGSPVGLATGTAHVCATVAGSGATSAYCWGSNSKGQLGNGTAADSNEPVAVTNSLADPMTLVYAGDAHSCAVSSAKALLCWGSNEYGQLGIGSEGDQRETFSPVDAPEEEPDVEWSFATAGYYNTCAVSGAGTCYCWGRASTSMNGNDRIVVDVLVPQPVTGTFDSPPKFLSGHGRTAFMILESGELYVWGYNTQGQSGLDTIAFTIGAPYPLATQVSAVASADSFACMISSAWDDRSQLLCWGANESGQLGIGSTASALSPRVVEASQGCRWDTVALGANAAYGTQVHAAPPAPPASASPPPPPPRSPSPPAVPSPPPPEPAPLPPGTGLYAWGSNASGALASALHVGQNTLSPALVSDTMQNPLAGADFACTFAQGVVTAWGSNSAGQLGRGAGFQDAYSPFPATVSVPGTIVQVAVGQAHVCAAVAYVSTATGYCWGANDSGQLGDGSTTQSPTPVAVQDSQSDPFESMFAGAAHSCGITAFSHMYCWGDNQYGQLGVGSTDGASAPHQVSDPSAEPDLDWAMGLAGLYNTCGVSKTHAVYCWGRAAYGMNGNSQTVYDATSPVAVSHSFTAPVAMAGSGNTAYLLDQGGDLYVWGSNVDGQSGLDLQVNTIGAPVLLVQKAVAAAGAETYGCYIAAPVKNNVLYCVGGNANGQLGIGSTASQQVPAQVDSNNGLQWEEIAAGPNAAYGTQALAPVQQEE